MGGVVPSIVGVVFKGFLLFLFVAFYSIEGPQGGETAAPLFILGDFAEAFVGERSPFEEVAMRKATLLGVHTAGSRRVLGGFSARSQQNFGKISAKFRNRWQ